MDDRLGGSVIDTSPSWWTSGVNDWKNPNSMESSLHLSCDLRSTVYIKLSCANERIDIISIKQSGGVSSVITFQEHADDRWCAPSALNIKQCLDNCSFAPMDTIPCESYTTERGECRHVYWIKACVAIPPVWCISRAERLMLCVYQYHRLQIVCERKILFCTTVTSLFDEVTVVILEDKRQT